MCDKINTVERDRSHEVQGIDRQFAEKINLKI
jgi:hypothetical protein